jgi:hypothetical protein
MRKAPWINRENGVLILEAQRKQRKVWRCGLNDEKRPQNPSHTEHEYPQEMTQLSNLRKYKDMEGVLGLRRMMKKEMVEATV